MGGNLSMNRYREDHTFIDLLKRSLDERFFEWADKELAHFAERTIIYDERARHTDREGQPRLIKYDRYGEDISEIWVNEGYRQTADEVYRTGIAAYPHKPIPQLEEKGNYIYAFAQGYLLSQVEPGLYCPVTLTMAVAYLLDHFADDSLKKKYLPHVISTGEVPLYEGATFLTERQGGSDVGANETKAVLRGDHYLLYGEKYFASNAGRAGVAAVLARIEGAGSGTKGLSLFLVPWRREDGSLNGITIRRLKDKLGVRAVPSAEVVFHGAKGFLIGEASKGFYYMMDALNLSRVCNAVASVGIMRRAFVEARDYAKRRTAFGARLIDFPMVKETLGKLAARQDAALRATFELVKRFDDVMGKPHATKESDKALLRLLIALLKARTAAEAIDFAHEAIHLHGGNGYIEDFVTPRLLRDAQVLTVWEGTENILALEVLRLIRKYRIHESFIRDVQDMLAPMPESLASLTRPVREGIERLHEHIRRLTKASEEWQTLYAKRIAHLMTDVFMSAVILRDAAGPDRTSKKISAAHVFIEEIWSNPHDWEKGNKAYTHFSELVDL